MKHIKNSTLKMIKRQTTKNTKTILLSFILLFISINLVHAQINTQTVRGTVIDQESTIPLIGAAVLILDSDPQIATTTDLDGNFTLSNVPVGRHSIKVLYLGYNPTVIPEIPVGSAKEVVLEIKLKEMITNLKEVKVSARKNKGDALNSMATLSARGFNVDETRRYAGGMDDPGRLASVYAGVASSGDAQSNAIMIRGNSPSGILWKVEGIEVQTPSHFANTDVLGGGAVTFFSNQMLDKSDFFTGAFPAEYGNALAGVFDVRLRKGNNQKYEHAVQFGLMGIDVSSEGPISKSKRSSYIFNYRYSTLGLVKVFLPEQGLPSYQDLCFKFNFPTSKAGEFSFWGIGGIDNYLNTASKDSVEWTNQFSRLELTNKYNSGTAGFNHKIRLGNKTYLKTSYAFSPYTYNKNVDYLNDDLSFSPFTKTKYEEYKNVIQSYVNHKFGARHSNKTGAIVTFLNYNYEGEVAKYRRGTLSSPQNLLGSNGNSSLYRFYTQSKFNVTPTLFLTAGLHSTYFELNQKYSIEPRAGIRWTIFDKHAISFAYGMHSQLPPLSIFFIQRQQNNETILPNKELDLLKANHYIIGYEVSISENMRLKVEPYYQTLWDVPVQDSGSFSILNLQQTYGFDSVLVNTGTGRNYGVDLTLEHFLKDGYYFMITGSLFESKYTGGDGIERNTLYNSNYVLNLLGGKEWQVGKNDNNVFGMNGRLYFKGGDRRSPVDDIKSIEEKDVVYNEDKAFEIQNPGFYRMDISVTYRINKTKLSHVLALQVNNVLFSPTYYEQNFDYTLNKVTETIYGNPFPSLSYRIEF